MNRIENLVELGKRLKTSESFQAKINAAVHKNAWFVPAFVQRAVDAITNEMLDEKKLNDWLKNYPLRETNKTIALIFAGNIPLVGFHDFLCCYVAGCKMKIKLSSKDDELFLSMLDILFSIDEELKSKIEIVEQLKNFDAVIATGSDNTNRYFEYYFRDYPKILRKNRNSVAILTGDESDNDLQKLADDIFLYFGFGCRNVSKLYAPAGYDFTKLFPQFEKKYSWLHDHTKYMRNYDYNRTLLMLNKIPHLANEFVMIAENDSIASPVAILNFEYWGNENELAERLIESSEKIQCVVSDKPQEWAFTSSVYFGESQQPQLNDYADGTDTLEFLLTSSKK